MGQREPDLPELEVDVLKLAEKLGFSGQEISELRRLYNSKETNE